MYRHLYTMYIRQMCNIIFLCTCLDKQKLVGFEPSTSLLVSSCLNHFASSIAVIWHTNKVHVYCSTWRLVTYVQRRTSRPTVTRPRHDVAGPSLSLHMDLFKTEPSSDSEAELGGALALRPDGGRACNVKGGRLLCS